ITLGREPVAVLDPAGLVAAMLDDLDHGVAKNLIAAGFHEAFGDATVALATRVAAEQGLDTVVLTGGVFQNARLTDVVETGLRRAGLNVLVHALIPPNDGGISVGQAAIAAFHSLVGGSTVPAGPPQGSPRAAHR
ncbi:MAG: hypothetical protein ABIZ69_00520, partial [Ilumatobacteraceae bacterium]